MALAALVLWWATFIDRSIDGQRQSKLQSLKERGKALALILGHRTEHPEPDQIVGFNEFEIVDSELTVADDLSSIMIPNHERLVVRPHREIVAEIERTFKRQLLMLYGEGSLLAVLLLITIFMLRRLVIWEKKISESMQKFVSTVTHELKTPLAGVKALLQTLEAGRVPEDKVQEVVLLGLKEIYRQEHMIGNILTAGRMESGQKVALDLEPLEVGDFLKSFVDHRNELVSRDQNPLELELDLAGKGTVRADYHSLHTVLDNLVDNAFKYGGKDRVLIKAVRQDEVCLVSVIDEGVGFERGESGIIFERFYRASTPDYDLQHGTGLGLYISRKLMRGMGGELTAKSSGRGKGSEFTLKLMMVR
jgi:two-component system, OmpR family, phosphate regulon sensor histidine kinase PhoR